MGCACSVVVKVRVLVGGRWSKSRCAGQGCDRWESMAGSAVVNPVIVSVVTHISAATMAGRRLDLVTISLAKT